MGRGRLWTWAGLGVLALLASNPVRAQVPLPGGTDNGLPLSPPPVGGSMPPPLAPSGELRPALPGAPHGGVPGPVEHKTSPWPGEKVPEAKPLESTESHHLDLNHHGEAHHGGGRHGEAHHKEGHHGEGHHEEGHHGECNHEEEHERGPCSGLFITGEYLLLRPRRQALDFAVVSPNLTEAPGGTIRSLDWETRSAFRTGIGWQLADEPWQVGVTYTYLHSAQDRTLTAPPGGTLFATLTRGGGVDDVTRAVGSTNLDFNVIDLDAARLISVSPHLDVKVFGGGRFAWIDQKLQAVYNGGSFNAQNTTVSSPVYFHGAGVTAGAQGFWKVYGGMGLFARSRLSLLSGQFRNFLTETDQNGTVSVVNVREKYYQVVPVTEVAVGAAYQGEHLFLSVGYEVQNWFNMVNSPDFVTGNSIGKVSRRTSDLSLEGLAVQLGFIF